MYMYILTTFEWLPQLFGIYFKGFSSISVQGKLTEDDTIHRLIMVSDLFNGLQFGSDTVMLTGLVVKTLASLPVDMFSSFVVERSVGVLENKPWSRLQRVKLNTLHYVTPVRRRLGCVKWLLMVGSEGQGKEGGQVNVCE